MRITIESMDREFPNFSDYLYAINVMASKGEHGAIQTLVTPTGPHTIISAMASIVMMDVVGIKNAAIEFDGNWNDLKRDLTAVHESFVEQLSDDLEAIQHGRRRMLGKEPYVFGTAEVRKDSRSGDDHDMDAMSRILQNGESPVAGIQRLMDELIDARNNPETRN